MGVGVFVGDVGCVGDGIAAVGEAGAGRHLGVGGGCEEMGEKRRGFGKSGSWGFEGQGGKGPFGVSLGTVSLWVTR